MINEDSAVLLATFSLWKNGARSAINGNVQPLVDFFRQRTCRTTLIDQPYPGSDRVLPRIEDYAAGSVQIHEPPERGLIQRWLARKNFHGTHIRFKIRDFASVFAWGLRPGVRYDVLIGLESINAIAGIALRKLGRVGTVVYYVSDYSPSRYGAGWFNRLYLWLDRFASSHSDYIWDVSKAMQPARIAAGLDPAKSAVELHVPNAIYPDQIVDASEPQNVSADIVFMGTLGPENGPDVAVEAIGAICKDIPAAKLHVIGGGEPDLSRLQALADKLGVTDRVHFHGFINDRRELKARLAQYTIAVAPYCDIPGHPRQYADATKIRAYMGAGLPVITTFVPPLGKEVAQCGAAVQVPDDSNALAVAAIDLLKHPERLRRMRLNALEFARQNTWEAVFTSALEKMKTDDSSSAAA